MRFEVPSQKPHFPDEITTHHRGIAELKHIQPHPAADENTAGFTAFHVGLSQGDMKMKIRSYIMRFWGWKL